MELQNEIKTYLSKLEELNRLEKSISNRLEKSISNLENEIKQIDSQLTQRMLDENLDSKVGFYNHLKFNHEEIKRRVQRSSHRKLLLLR